jgi:signal transduction histidine kinase
VVIVGQLLTVSLVTPLPELTVATLLLAVTGALATLLETREPPPVAGSLAEAFVAGAVIAATAEPTFLLAYLIVPGFSVGLRRGWRPGLGTVAAGLTGVLVSAAIRGIAADPALLLPVGFWLLTAVGMVVLGAWARRRLTSDDRAAYLDAARLLGQLEDLTPRLSGGVDPAAIATALLDDLDQVLPYDQAAVFVRDRIGSLPTCAASRLAAPDWVDEMCLLVAGPVTETTTPQRVWVHSLDTSSRFTVVAELDGSPAQDALDGAERLLARYEPRLRVAQAFHAIWQSATQQERQRVSREIHDGIAQDLASLAYVADGAVDMAESENDRERMAEVRDSLRLVLADLRLSIFDLRATESWQPLPAAVSDLARRTAEAAGLELEVHISGQGTLPGEVERELTRIAQEALTNVRKHAQARRIWVDIEQDGAAVLLRVADDGRGLGWRQKPSLSAGMAGMKERADSVGARLTVESALAAGTVITVEYGGVDGGAHSAERPDRGRPRAHP